MRNVTLSKADLAERQINDKLRTWFKNMAKLRRTELQYIPTEKIAA
jgi:hypothetical protein